MLFQDSDFNISSREINKQFAGSQHLVIYMEGSRPHVLKKPELLAMIENFRRYMLEQEEAGWFTVFAYVGGEHQPLVSLR